MATKALRKQIDLYLADEDEDGRSRNRSDATKDQYRFILERVWLPWCESEGITDAAQADMKVMNRFTGHLEKLTKPNGAKLSIQTQRTYIRGVRVFLDKLGVAKGAYKQPKPPKRNGRDMALKLPTREEIEAMEKAAGPNKRDQLIVRVLADTGIRVGELIGLRRGDVIEGWDRHRNKTFFLRVEGKTGERRVPIPPQVARRLQNYADHLPDGGHIFLGSRRSRKTGVHEQLTKSGVDQLIRHLAKEAQVNKRVYPHLFRHAYITYQHSRGVSPITLQNIVGHSSLAMISQVYGHPSDDDMYEAARGMYG